MSAAGDRPERDVSVRFAVGSLDGPRAAVWELWTDPEGDVYVGARGIQGELKVSLHKSGRWRAAFSKQHARRPSSLLEPERDRAFLKWQRPPEYGPGVTHALDIHVPDPDVITPRGELGDDVEIVWVDCPIDFEIVFSLIIGSPDAFATGWPGRRSMGTAFVYYERLGNGEQLWVVWKARRLDPGRRKELVTIRARCAQEIAAQGIELTLDDPTGRVMAMGQESGTGSIGDLALAALLSEAGAHGLSIDARGTGDAKA